MKYHELASSKKCPHIKAICDASDASFGGESHQKPCQAPEMEVDLFGQTVWTLLAIECVPNP